MRHSRAWRREKDAEWVYAGYIRSASAFQDVGRFPRAFYETTCFQINPEIKNIDDFGMDDVKLVSYKHQGRIKATLL